MTILADLGIAVAALIVLCMLLVGVLLCIGTWLTWRDTPPKPTPAPGIHMFTYPTLLATVCGKCCAELGESLTLDQSKVELLTHELLDCPALLRDEHGTPMGGTR